MVFDCGVLIDFYSGYNIIEDVVEFVVWVFEVGVDVNCGGIYVKGL